MTKDSKSEDFSQAKEITNNKTTDVWVVYSQYIEDFGLSAFQALLYSILVNLSVKKGFAYPSNDFLCKKIGIKEDKTIRNNFKIFKEKNLIYVHYYNTQKGQRREIVTRENAAVYWSYLKNNNKFLQLKKFEEEFLSKISSFSKDINSEKEPIDTDSNSTQTTETQPAVINTAAAAVKNTGALNTMYLDYSTRTATCKSAVSLNYIKKELEKELCVEDIEIGIKWYELQPQRKKDKMEKPVACIINAVKKKYAHEEVKAHYAEVAAKQKEKEEEVLKFKLKKSEESRNEVLAKRTIEKFKNLDGFRAKIDGKCVTIFNDKLEKLKDVEGGYTYAILPNGEKLLGVCGIRADFSESREEFKNKIIDFLRKNLWLDPKTA
jgi:hypothetical protein